MGYTLFPGAVLFRPEFYEAVESRLKVQQSIDMADYGYVHKTWCFFLPFDCWLKEENTRQFVASLGNDLAVPLLHYWNTEQDVCFIVEEGGKQYIPSSESWGYELFFEGSSVARSSLRCDLPEWDESLLEQIKTSYPNANTEAFGLFGMSQEQCKELNALIEPSSLLQLLETEDMLTVASTFQDLLEIQDVFRS